MKSIKHSNGHIIPGYRFSMSITLGMLTLLIIIPLVSVISSVFRISFSRFFSILLDKSIIYAFETSISCSFIAALVNACFGTVLAWILVRYEFPGKRIVDGMIELPFAMPTAVAGITLSKMYSTTGEPGRFLSGLGINVSYTKLGIITALVFVGIPFTVRAVMPVLEKINGVYEEAAYTLGAGSVTTFFRVIMPELFPAILIGFSLAFARGIGEYGSVIYISGNNVKEHTQVVSYIIMQKLNYMDYESATVIAFVMLIISFMILFFINMIQLWQSHRVNNNAGTVVMKRNRTINNSPLVKGFTIMVGIAFVLLMLLYPLISVISNSLSRGLIFYWRSISTMYVKSALVLTVVVTLITIFVNTLFGVMASWFITRFDFRGKQVLATLIDIPFSISPVIAGLSYIMMFGRMGWAYPIITWINDNFGMDIQIVFAFPGVVLATIFVTFPFVAREIIPVLNVKGRDEEAAAALMGATGTQIFRYITFPHIKWSLVYGVILCAARAMGEFGAVNALSKTRGKTFTLPLEIDALYMAGGADSITSAFAVSSILVLIAIVILLLRSLFEYREKNRCI